MRRICAALLVSTMLGWTAPAFAQRPTARATYDAGNTVSIDGRLTEPFWQRVEWHRHFLQRDPAEGAEASELTEVAFAFDEHALIVAARMSSRSDSGVVADVTRRDTESQSEMIAISLDTYLDRRTAYTFAVTSAGTRLDYYHPRDDESDRDYSFDPVWHARVQRTPEGWTAELRIPFSQLRFRDATDHTFGLNIRRRTPARNEDVYWVLIRKNDNGWASRFGDLTGISGIAPSRRIEVMPYATSGTSIQTAPNAANPLESRFDGVGRAGADLKMGVGPNLTLEATLNPDFGQVELDPAEVNLSAFETIFTERRPFFVEGSQLLRGGDASYFYSRRIGGAPSVSVPGAFAVPPASATILGAAKITGRLASGLSVGALGAVSAAEDTRRVLRLGDDEDSVRTTPRTSFGLVRLQQQFGASASTAGMVLTHVGRDLRPADLAAAVLARRATAGSVDWNLRFRQGEYEFRGDLGFSHVAGEAAAITRLQRSSARYFQRPDAPHVELDPTRTALSGYRAILELRRNRGRHWLWSTSYILESPGFELNDAGRIANVDSHYVSGSLTYRQTRPGRIFRQWSFNVFADTSWTTAGERDRLLHSVNVNTTWRDFSQTTWHYHHELPGQSTSLTRGGPLMATPFFWDAYIRHTTNPARRVSASLYALYDENALGRRGIDIRPQVTLRPGPAWNVSGELIYVANTQPRQYATELAGGSETPSDGDTSSHRSAGASCRRESG